MGQAPLDLPDPLLAKPLADAGAADDLLSRMAGDEIDRLLAEADEANDEPSYEEQAAATAAAETRIPDDAGEIGERSPAPGLPAAGSNPSKAPPSTAEVERRETAVSSFVADGDPALEAELDNLLANLNSSAVSQSEPGMAAPPVGQQAVASSESGAAGAVAPAAEAPPAPVLSKEPEPPDQSSSPPREQSAPDNAAEADPLVKGELDQVFDKMTASAGPAPQVGSPTTSEPAKPAGSIDLLKVLDPIVAEDAAKAEQAAAASDAGTPDEETTPAEERLPIYVLVLEWVNAPLGWLPSPVRDAMGKIGILTLINAAAVLLYVLFFRRK